MQTLYQQLRPGQRDMGDWQKGPLAVSAVPGSGKSTGMAIAAALTIARQRLHPRHQLLIVTFTRSAAANIQGKNSPKPRTAQTSQMGLFRLHHP